MSSDWPLPSVSRDVRVLLPYPIRTAGRMVNRQVRRVHLAGWRDSCGTAPNQHGWLLLAGVLPTSPGSRLAGFSVARFPVRQFATV